MFNDVWTEIHGIIYVKDYCNFELLGKTRDDAIGEAFDKVARVIGLRISTEDQK